MAAYGTPEPLDRRRPIAVVQPVPAYNFIRRDIFLFFQPQQLLLRKMACNIRIGKHGFNGRATVFNVMVKSSCSASVPDPVRQHRFIRYKYIIAFRRNPAPELPILLQPKCRIEPAGLLKTPCTNDYSAQGDKLFLQKCRKNVAFRPFCQ